MLYFGIPLGMWALFRSSFQKNLTEILGFDTRTAAKITLQAKSKCKEIIVGLPNFEPQDHFKMNLVGCAMLASFLLNMEEKPTSEQLTEYYEKSMMTPTVQWIFRQSGKKKFSQADIRSMKNTAALRAADRNKYSWNMEFYEYKDGSGYEARFTKCGICTLMEELELSEFIPSMCHLDYAMTEAGGAADFVREYTLASGGPYCDCGYKKRRNNKCLILKKTLFSTLYAYLCGDE